MRGTSARDPCGVLTKGSCGKCLRNSLGFWRVFLCACFCKIFWCTFFSRFAQPHRKARESFTRRWLRRDTWWRGPQPRRMYIIKTAWILYTACSKCHALFERPHLHASGLKAQAEVCHYRFVNTTTCQIRVAKKKPYYFVPLRFDEFGGIPETT